jgi:hypothetical protein
MEGKNNAKFEKTTLWIVLSFFYAMIFYRECPLSFIKKNAPTKPSEQIDI